MIKTYNDFLQLIDEGPIKGYRVCFESSSIEMERWTAANYLEYIDNLERHKHETGISLQYEILGDNDKPFSVDVFIHYPEEKDIPERNHVMHWIVQNER